MLLNDNISILADSSTTESQLILSDSAPVSFNHSNLVGCNVESDNTYLSFTESYLKNVHILQKTESLLAENSYFNCSNIEGYNLPITDKDSLSVMVINCIFENMPDSTAIRLYSYPRFKIAGNTISNYYSALSLFEYGLGNDNEVSNNTFTDNQFGYGIQSYHSYAKVIGSNVIKNNYIGIAGLRNSEIVVCGSPNPPLQMIYDQYNLEMAFMHDSFPGKMYHNVVFDIVHPNDALIQCMNCPYTEIHDLTHNNWNDTKVDNYLLPSDYMNNEPVWDLAASDLPGLLPEAEIYEMALNNIQIGNYHLAESLLKQIISEYPNSISYVKLAEKQLLAAYSTAGDDFFVLKHFYASEPNLHNDNGIDQLTDYLVVRCLIKLEDYESAIQWFESVISNPDTPEDGIYATIDLAYTYLLMSQEKSAPTVATIYPNLVPRSMQEFKKKSDDNINLLLKGFQSQNTVTPPPITFKVYQNYPNPFNGSTTFSFDLPRTGKVKLAVYNIKGQLVKDFRLDSLAKGKQKVVWDCRNKDGRGIASGIYFYRVRYEGKTVTKKMCYVK